MTKKPTLAQERMLTDVAAGRVARTRTPDGWRWTVGTASVDGKKITTINRLLESRLVTVESSGIPPCLGESQPLILTAAGQEQLGGSHD